MEIKNDAVVVKSPAESDPKRTNTKPLSFTNGVVKRQRHHIDASPPPSLIGVVSYKECLKNHAAALGGHALDGCGEFMPDRSVTSNPNLPISLKCAVCGCHRNFHRREPEDSPMDLHLLTPTPTSAIDYQPHHHRHQQPIPLTSARPTSPYPPSPPPISSSYYPSSAPRMLLALSTGLPPSDNTLLHQPAADPVSGSSRKRFRTKFSNLQKEKMYEIAERVGWKMQKKDEEIVSELCNRIGVGREVFKVWMHNNKTTFNKRSSLSAEAAGNENNNIFFHNGIHQENEQVNTSEHHHHSLLGHLNAANGGNTDNNQHQQDHHHTTNGSFSSS